MKQQFGCRVPIVRQNTEHGARSNRRQLTYVFTPKHHGHGGDSSQWIAELTLDEEFAIFDRADGIETAIPEEDHRQVADESGNLYGCLPLTDGTLGEIGTWYQQLAEFPVQGEGEVWHGYPIWPVLHEDAPANYQGQRCRPSASIFRRMSEIGTITKQQQKRLMKGERA